MAQMVRWDPWGEIAALQRDVQQLFGRGGDGPTTNRSLVPPMDAHRTDDALVVHLDLPGFEPKQVEVNVQDGVLSVSGHRAATTADDGAWLRRERAAGAFERSFTLPDGTDPSAITADFRNGVLELRVPHPQERKPHRVSIGATSDEQAAVDVDTS